MSNWHILLLLMLLIDGLIGAALDTHGDGLPQKFGQVYPVLGPRAPPHLPHNACQ